MLQIYKVNNFQTKLFTQKQVQHDLSSMKTLANKPSKQHQKKSLLLSKSKQIKLFQTIKQQQMPSIPSVPAFPDQKGLYSKISRDIGNDSKVNQKKLKMNINNHYRKHLSNIQRHHHKIIYLIDAHQRKNLKSQQRSSIQIINQEKKSARKATITLKQEKALANKKHEMLAKSKKVQQSLVKWRQIVNKNKTIERQKKIYSSRALQQLQQKIEASTSRKMRNLKQIKSQMKQQTRKVDSKQSARKKTENLSESRASKNSIKVYANAFNNRTIHNPEEQSVKSTSSRKSINLRQNHLRYHSNAISRHSISHQRSQGSSIVFKAKNTVRISPSSRVSTESIAKKKQQIEQEELQKILYQKQQTTLRIRQARQIKRYLNQQRQHRVKQNSQRMSELMINHKDESKKKKQIRKDELNRKFKQNRARMRDVSLPTIHKSKMLERQLYEMIKNEQRDISLANTLNYQKMIEQKLKNMSSIMDKYVLK